MDLFLKNQLTNIVPFLPSRFCEGASCIFPRSMIALVHIRIFYEELFRAHMLLFMKKSELSTSSELKKLVLDLDEGMLYLTCTVRLNCFSLSNCFFLMLEIYQFIS